MITPTDQRIQLFFEGDSITQKFGPCGDGNEWPAQLLASLPVSYNTENLAVGGSAWGTLHNRATALDAKLSADAPRHILCVMCGTNDLLSVAPSYTAAEIWTNCQDYCSDRQTAGWTVVLITPPPAQLPGTPADYESRRQTLLGLVRAGWAGIADYLVDYSANVYIGVGTAPTDHPSYWVNADHLGVTGEAVLAGYVEAMIGPLLQVEKRYHVYDEARYPSGPVAHDVPLHVYDDAAGTIESLIYAAETGGSPLANPYTVPATGRVDIWITVPKPYVLAGDDTTPRLLALAVAEPDDIGAPTTLTDNLYLADQTIDGDLGVLGKVIPVTTDVSCLGDLTHGYKRLYLHDGTDEWAVGINSAGAIVTAKRAINACIDPSFELDTNADGMADNWMVSSASVTGTPVYSRVAGRLGGYAQRIQYTGVAGDASGDKAIHFTEYPVYVPAPERAAAEGEVWTLSDYFTAALSGCTVSLRLVAWNSAFGYLDETSEPVTVQASPTRFHVHHTMPASTAWCSCMVSILGIGNGDTADITIDDVLRNKSADLDDYFDGSYPLCEWADSRAPNASASIKG